MKAKHIDIYHFVELLNFHKFEIQYLSKNLRDLNHNLVLFPLHFYFLALQDLEINFLEILLNKCRYLLFQFLDLTQRDMLFEKIYRALLPGGVLLVSEKVHYENKYQTNRIFRTHHKFKAANGYSDLEISGKRDSLEGVLLTEYEEDHLLRASKAGFKKTEKVLSNLNFRTFVFLK